MGVSSWMKRKLFTVPGGSCSDLIDVKFNYVLMKPVGLDAVMSYGEDENTLAYRGSVIWAWFCAVYLSITLLCEAEELRRSAGDLDRMTVNACVMLIVAMGVCKSVGVLVPRRRLAQLLRRLRHGFPPTHNAEQLQVLRGAAVHVRAITLAFGVLSLCLVCMWNSLPLLQAWLHLRRAQAHFASAEATGGHNDSLAMPPTPKFERLLPLMAWYPFDAQGSLAIYAIVYMSQNFCSFIYGCVHIGVDTFYLSYIIYISAHLNVLSIRFRDLRQEAWIKLGHGTNRADDKRDHRVFNNTFFETSQYYENKEIDMAMTELFAQNVRYHQEIIQFVRDLEKLMSPVMLVQFFISAVIICLSGFQATVTVSDFTLALKYLVYLATAAFQLALYCWYGQMLIDESLGVHRAVYETEWPEATTPLKRAIQIVMMRAQRPVSLASAKIYVLSLDTFVKVLNTSYSFFAVLRQVNEPKSGEALND